MIAAALFTCVAGGMYACGYRGRYNAEVASMDLGMAIKLLMLLAIGSFVFFYVLRISGVEIGWLGGRETPKKKPKDEIRRPTGATHFIKFKSTFPDDSAEDENGNVITPTGKNVSLRIAELLIGQGLSVSSPQQHRFYGWEIIAKYGDVNFSILLQWPADGLIILRPKLSPWEKLTFKRNSAQLGALSEMLITAMTEHGQFSEVSRKYYKLGTG